MKIVLEVQLDKELQDDDIIVCKRGKWKAVSKTSFLSAEMKKYNEDMKKVDERFKILENINEVYWRLLAKSIYDAQVLNGVFEYDDKFEEAFSSYLNGSNICFEEVAPEEYLKILKRIRGENSNEKDIENNCD